MSNQIAISARNLSIGYPKNRKDDKTVLHKDFSFDLYTGELTCLLGENGAGKSTLLRTITGLQAPLSGDISLFGKSLSTYKEQELSTLLGVVLTDKTATGGFTVSELVSLGRYPYTGFFGKLSSEDNRIIEQAMNDVGIIHKSQSYVAELSDGERQKVMIAKALAQECPIIVLDEPTAFLDVVNRIEIMNLLHHLAIDKNKAILLSTHDIELSLLLADRLWLLGKEKNLICGMTEDIVLSNALNEYIGNKEISFDKDNGRFLTKQSSEKEIYLEAEGNLYYWTENFLTRNGYKLSQDSSKNVLIRVSSPQNITVKMHSSVQNLDSFEQLYNYLKAQTDITKQ